MVFALARTFSDPTNSQSGFPPIGAGAQTSGAHKPAPTDVAWQSERPTKGLFSWLFPTRPQDAARGFPAPEDASQRRPQGSMPNVAPMFGGVFQKWTPDYSRGAAAFVPNFGKVLTNPIGAGIVAMYRPQASYGGAAQYENGAIWWTSQAIPTSVNLQGLTSPDELSALFDGLTVQAMVRTTG